ncbi:MAG: hypothetical protein KC464_07015, partial [Myxococcales bacterium]|nr:hypothetical protein [Myxococcales bacterium]
MTLRPTSSDLPAHLTRLPDLDAAWTEASAGVRLDAVRRDGRRLRDTLADRGPAIAVRTADLITFPYPTGYGLQGAARSPAPYVMMRNRVQLVQVDCEGTLINILVNPSDPERSKHAPFFARQVERYGELVARRLMTQTHGTVAGALAAWGVDPADIDYVTFDHLHVQDLRGLLGTTEPEPGATAPTPALLPNARLLVQARELRILDHLHPLQVDWFVADGIRGVSPDRFVVVDGDYAVGAGFAIVRTPGHTEGNHSPTIVTSRGLWTISENGVCADAYAPESSRIPGLRAWARATGCEVVLNANTREHSLDQYTSMVLEKTLADPSTERPEFVQHFSSSEMVRHVLAPGLAPTFSHGAIEHGQVQAKRTWRRG